MAVKMMTGSVIPVPVAGTAVPLDAATPTARAASSVLIQAEFGNTGTIYIGDSTVTTTTGFALCPGDSMEISGDNRTFGQDEVIVNDLFVNADSAGDKVRVGFFVKRKGTNP